jgi:hypothetical protein
MMHGKRQQIFLTRCQQFIQLKKKFPVDYDQHTNDDYFLKISFAFARKEIEIFHKHIEF